MSSESPVVEIYSSDGYELSVKDGVAIPVGTRGILSAGSDGTNSRFITLDTSGRQVVVGIGTAGTPVGGVLSVQGISGGTVLPISGTVTANAGTGTFTVAGTVTSNQGTANTLANAWSTKITDATNGPAAVKAASTAAAATDPALVVAISPNNTVTVVQATAANLKAQTASEFTTATTTGTIATLIGAAVTTAAPTYTTGQMSALSLTTTGALRIDGSAVTQPVSGTVTANQGTANTLANAWSTKITDATNGPAAVKAASTAAVATDLALVVAISPNNSIAVTSTGTSDVTATGALGALNAAVQVTLAGHQSVGFQLAAGTLIGTIVAEMSFDGGTTWNATYFDQTTGNKVHSVVFSSSNTALGSTMVGVGGSGLARIRVSAYTSGTANITLRASLVDDPSVLYGGVNGSSTLPPVAAQIAGVYNNTTLQTISVDSQGRIITSPPSSISSLSGFSNGYVALAVNTKSFVGATTYTEQTTGVQRSVSSGSANDTSAGTGAQQVTIVWFDSTGAGPNSETVTLNGTANVNTVSTTMCYIESITVSRVGSGGSNVGVITLHAAAAGGGVVVGTIAVGDNQTFWCHHYVPTGKTCYITGINTGANNNAGATFTTTAKSIGVTGAVENQISDFIRNGGGGNASQPSFTRNYGTPLQVAGPARINGYVNPDQATASNYWLSFDFYQQ